MKEKAFLITEKDMVGLCRLLDTKGKLGGRDKQHLRDLKKKLASAVIVEDGDIAYPFVTMNSRIRLKDLDTGTVGEYTLVYPGEADIRQGKLSVLAPVGTALIGHQELDTVEWMAPAGRKRHRIEEILYQPETAEADSA